jgi:hypothetical protein
MKLLANLLPIAEAIDKLASKTPALSPLRSAQWEAVPMALRDRAFFSAGVEHARFLDTAKDQLMKSISLQREQVLKGEAFVDRSSFLGAMRKLALGENLSDRTGGLTDLASRARLGLIFDMQTNQAFGFARYKFEQDPDVLNAFPAQELVRIEARVTQRPWRDRWVRAGGALIQGRMVALKTNSVWESLSRFGTPWPPFDYGSGMGLRDVSRQEAVDLGLISADSRLVPSLPEFNRNLQAGVSNLPPDMLQFLQAAFGNQVEIRDGAARWKEAA